MSQGYPPLLNQAVPSNFLLGSFIGLGSVIVSTVPQDPRSNVGHHVTESGSIVRLSLSLVPTLTDYSTALVTILEWIIIVD